MLNYSLTILDKTLKLKQIPVSKFELVIEKIDKQLKNKENLFFDLNFVDKKTIHQINKSNRNVNKPTDVISFAFRDAKKSIRVNLLGEIFICYEIALKQAKENKSTIEKEMCMLFIHGILHLFQYDHMDKKTTKKMFTLQNNILESLKFNKINYVWKKE